MPTISLQQAVVLILSLFYVVTLARILPKDLKHLPGDLVTRQICVEDDLLLSLKDWGYDAEEWCRARLPITDITVAAFTVTARTTTTITSTTFATTGATTVVPSITSTITVSPLPLQKRLPGPIPDAGRFADLPLIADIDNGVSDKNLYSSALSACGCLFLQTRTIQAVSTVQLVRTLKAIEYDTTVSYSTSTSGIVKKYITLAKPSLTISVDPSPIPPLQAITATELPSVDSTIASISPPLKTKTSLSIISISPLPLNTPTSSPAVSTTLSPPASLPTLGPCPTADNTIYSFANDAEFFIECYTHREGPSTVGLARPNLRSCIQACATANAGFSIAQCYAVSYFPQTQGVNCFFKTLGSTSVYDVSSQEISARLLLRNASSVSSIIPKNSTVSASLSALLPAPTTFLNISGLNSSFDPTGYLNTGKYIPSASIGTSLNPNITISPSAASTDANVLIPNIPMNLTGISKPTINAVLNQELRAVPHTPSITAANSFNITSFPSSAVPSSNETIAIGGTTIDFRNVLYICSNLNLLPTVTPTSTSADNITKTVVLTSIYTLVVTTDVINPATSIPGVNAKLNLRD